VELTGRAFSTVFPSLGVEAVIAWTLLYKRQEKMQLLSYKYKNIITIDKGINNSK
jgi:hypothetical protein